MNKEIPKVSLIVPIYNVEKFLEKCLDSLVAQTLDGMEIILVDDGSTDNSSRIAAQYAVKYDNMQLLHKVNGGLSDARNYGMKYATGKYIAFLDSDDYVEPEMYQKLYEKAEEDNSDIVECNLYHDFQDSITPEYGNKIYDKGEMIRIGRSVVWNKIYRRDWLEQQGVLFPKGLIYEDVEFFCEIVPGIRKMSYIDDVLIHYVQRSVSINNKSTIKTKQILVILKNIIQYYKEKHIFNEYSQSIEYLCIRIILCSSYMRMIRIADKAQRQETLRANYAFLEKEFPRWKKNVYLKKQKDFKGIYMKLMNKPIYWGMAGLWSFSCKLFPKNKKY